MNHTSKLVLTNIISLVLNIFLSAILLLLGNQILVRFIKVDSANAYIYEMSFFEQLVLSTEVIILIFTCWKCLILLKNIIVNGVFSFKAFLGTKIVLVILAYLILAISGAGFVGANKIDLYIFKNLLIFFIAAVSLPVLEHKMRKLIFHEKD